jgi:maleate isomerase
MDRRELLGYAAAAMMPACHLRPQEPDSPWQPDGAGPVARFGVLTPDFDPVPESEMWAMAPRGVSLHGARVIRQGRASDFAEPPHVDNAVVRLRGLKPKAVLFAFTSSSYALGAEAEAAVRTRLEAQSNGAPVLLTCMAAREALQLLEVRRLALVHPPWFSEDTNQQGQSYFREQGFEVLASSRLSPSRTFQEVRPAEVYEWTRGHVPADAEAVFIGGNGLRAIGVIQQLERDLRKVVLTANQVLFWQALTLTGVAAQVHGYGRIFYERSPAVTLGRFKISGGLTSAGKRVLAVGEPSKGPEVVPLRAPGTLAPSSSWVLAAQLPIYLGVIAMAAFYLSGIVLLWERPSWRSRLTHLAPVGQMALTNYLTHSLIYLALFYGFGLALLGRVGATFCLALSAVIFGAQVLFSAWWLRRFRFGPAEWLWRSLTYGSRQPMRLGIRGLAT